MIKFETKISGKITEVIPKDAPLSYFAIHNIYEFFEGEWFDKVTYDYYQTVVKTH